MRVDLERRDHRYRLAGVVLALGSTAGAVYEATAGPDWLAVPVMVGMAAALVLLIYSGRLWSERVIEGD